MTEDSAYIRYPQMTTAVAKVFQSGNSQAIRLPKAFRLKTRTVKLIRTEKGILITTDMNDKKKARAFARLAGSCPDFPEIEPVHTPDLPREG